MLYSIFAIKIAEKNVYSLDKLRSLETYGGLIARLWCSQANILAFLLQNFACMPVPKLLFA